jgi:hypothetical protein
MAIVDFDSAIWSDRWFKKLSAKNKILFIYLWSNDHKNVAGLYEICCDQVAFETGLTLKEVEKGLTELTPKVLYDQETETVLVVKHVKRQFMRTNNISPKIVSAIHKNLNMHKDSSLIGVFLNEYDTLSIPYTYPIDRVHMYPSSGGGGEGGGVSNGSAYSKDFEIFWDMYPKKTGKGGAFNSWKKIKGKSDIMPQILKAVEDHKTCEQWNRDNGQYIPNPQTWLNQRRWEDEIKPEATGLGSVPKRIACEACGKVSSSMVGGLCVKCYDKR